MQTTDTAKSKSLIRSVRAAVIKSGDDKLRATWDATRIERIQFLLRWKHPACDEGARKLAEELIDDTKRTEWLDAVNAAQGGEG